MLIIFTGHDGQEFAINPAQVLAVEPTGHGTSVVRLGHSLSYTVPGEPRPVTQKLNGLVPHG